MPLKLQDLPEIRARLWQWMNDTSSSGFAAYAADVLRPNCHQHSHPLRHGTLANAIATGLAEADLFRVTPAATSRAIAATAHLVPLAPQHDHLPSGSGVIAYPDGLDCASADGTTAVDLITWTTSGPSLLLQLWVTSRARQRPPLEIARASSGLMRGWCLISHGNVPLAHPLPLFLPPPGPRPCRHLAPSGSRSARPRRSGRMPPNPAAGKRPSPRAGNQLPPDHLQDGTDDV